MGRSAKERMRAYRARKQAAGCKAAKLWLDVPLQARVAGLRQPGESLEGLLRRALDAVEAVAPLQGKILLLQTEYILPLREELASLRKRLHSEKEKATLAGLREAITRLHARNQRLEQIVTRLQTDFSRLHIEKQIQNIQSVTRDVTPKQPAKAAPTDLKAHARELYLSGLSPPQVWDTLAAQGTPPGSRGNILRYLAPGFVEQVRHAAAAALAGQAGERVPIKQVWEVFQGQARRRKPPLTYSDFQSRLLQAQRAGELRLEQAESGAATKALAASATGENGRVWHYVALPASIDK